MLNHPERTLSGIYNGTMAPIVFFTGTPDSQNDKEMPILIK